MAARTPDLRKFLFSVDHSGSDRRIVVDDTAGHRKRRLKQCDCRDIRPSEFIHKTIAVRVDADPETFLRLDPVMVIERIVGELPQRNHVPSLMERSND